MGAVCETKTTFLSGRMSFEKEVLLSGNFYGALKIEAY